MSNKKLSEKVVVRCSTEQYKKLKNESEELNISISEYIRGKLENDTEIHNKDYIYINKKDIGKWYVGTIGCINSIDDKEVYTVINERMEALECLLLK